MAQITLEKINQARQAGYSDTEIADFLANKGYADKIEKARQAGYGDDEIVGFLEQKSQPAENKPKISRGEAAFTSLTNPLEFGDEIKGGIASLVAKGFGGEATKDIPLKELYKEARDAERVKQKQAFEQYPFQTIGAGLVSDLGASGKILKAGKFAKGYKGVAQQAGVLGELTGLGLTEDISDAPETIKDMVISGKFSQAMGVAGKGISDLVGVGINRIRNKPTADDVMAKVVNPEQAAEIANKLERTQAQGRNVIAPEVAGDEVAGFTRLLAKTPGSKQIINDTLNKRTASSSKRVANLINNKISAESYFGKADDTIKARSELSKPLYEKVEKEFPNIPTIKDIKNRQVNQLPVAKKEIEIADKFENFIQDGRIKKAYNDAKKDYGIGEAPINSFKALDGIKKALGDVAGEAKRSNAGEKAREFTSLKHNLVNFLDDINPDYKTARQTYAGQSELLESLELGRNFDKEFKTANELKRYLKDLTPGEKDTFKIGYAERLKNISNKTADNTSGARKISGNRDIREKTLAVFDKPQEYRDFSRKLKDEIQIFDTKQRILGGSRTDINLKDEAEIINKVTNSIISPKTAGAANVISAVKDSLQKRYIGLNEQNAAEIARNLASPKKSIEMFKRIAAKATPEQKQIIQQTYKDILPMIIGSQVGVDIVQPLVINQENTQE